MASTHEFEFPRFNVGEGGLEGVSKGPTARPSSASLITSIPEDGPPEVPAPMDLEGGPTRRQGRMPTISGNRETVHRVGQGALGLLSLWIKPAMDFEEIVLLSVMADTWVTVGFHFLAALNTSFILGYPALIMAYLGWVVGILCLVGGGIMSLYNNCLLGNLHEAGGIRHIRYRDLCGHVYGPFMYRLTWFIQYFNLSIANIGTTILAGESLKAIGGSICDGTDIHLAGWIAITGAICFLFACFVPNLHALRLFSVFSIALSLTYTITALVISLKDGLRAGPRDYSLVGTTATKSFNAVGALATIAFAFNTGILPEMQATIRRPTATNIYKALGMQFTIGTFPFLMLTFVGYWAYGNAVKPYLLLNLSGPQHAVTAANTAAFLQAIVSLHIYATPMYEFMDTYVAKRMKRKNTESEFSMHRFFVRFVTRGMYLALSTFLGALLPFFGDFIALTGALAAFPLESGLIHHMYLKVRGEDFGVPRRIWHWLNVVASVILTIATAVAGFHYIVQDSALYHAFANI